MYKHIWLSIYTYVCCVYYRSKERYTLVHRWRLCQLEARDIFVGERSSCTLMLPGEYINLTINMPSRWKVDEPEGHCDGTYNVKGHLYISIHTYTHIFICIEWYIYRCSSRKVFNFPFRVCSASFGHLLYPRFVSDRLHKNLHRTLCMTRGRVVFARELCMNVNTYV